MRDGAQRIPRGHGPFLLVYAMAINEDILYQTGWKVGLTSQMLSDFKKHCGMSTPTLTNLNASMHTYAHFTYTNIYTKIFKKHAKCKSISEYCNCYIKKLTYYIIAFHC